MKPISAFSSIILMVAVLLVSTTQSAINLIDFTACAKNDKTGCGTMAYTCCAAFTLAD